MKEIDNKDLENISGGRR
ncbi:bacteriocin [Alteromonas lipotrueiana]